MFETKNKEYEMLDSKERIKLEMDSLEVLPHLLIHLLIYTAVNYTVSLLI